MAEEEFKLSEEDIKAGAELIPIEPGDVFPKPVIDVSDKQVEKMAKGFILGTASIGRRHEIREKLESRVTKRIGTKGKWLVDKLFELIEGVYVIQSDKKDGIRYYKVPPNLQAITYALDRVLGKPTQHIEASEEKRGLILVEHVIKNLANNPYKKNEERTGGDNVGSGNEDRGADDGAS